MIVKTIIIIINNNKNTKKNKNYIKEYLYWNHNVKIGGNYKCNIKWLYNN